MNYTVADFGTTLREAEMSAYLWGVTKEARDEFQRLVHEFEDTFFAEEGVKRVRARAIPKSTQLGPLAGTKLFEMKRWLQFKELC